MKPRPIAITLLSTAAAVSALAADEPLPRNATPAEAAIEALMPRIADRGPGTTPTGPVLCPGEYAPCEGIILSYHPNYSGQLAIVRQMAVNITTIGQARVWIVFSSTTSRDAALSQLQTDGANMSRVIPIVSSLNSIWMRDYGPRYIYEGGGPNAVGAVRGIVDHTYNRPTRTLDNNFPIVFSNFKKHALYTIPLIHGGGNFHLDSLGRSYATRLIANENPTLSDSQIIGYWQQFQNVTTTLYSPFPTTVDATQHIDMWVQVMADDKVMVSEWTANRGSTQDTICEFTAVNLAAAGQQITRVPARLIGGVHYTYTNVVMCNDLVLVPTYTNASVAPLNAQALAAYQSALPGKAIVGINCESIVSLAGVMHCICMHVPLHQGASDGADGLAPTAFLRAPNGGQNFAPGSLQTIRWSSDDDNAVSNVDLHLSFDSGATWPVTIAEAAADTGTFNWTVPNYFTRSARVRVQARDAGGAVGGDLSDTDFSIAGTCRADFNNSLTLSVQDVFDFLAAFFSNAPAADFNDSGGLSVQDLFDFLNAYFAGCS